MSLRIPFLAGLCCIGFIGSMSASIQSTASPVPSALERITGRSFPSIFQAWNGVGHGPWTAGNGYLTRHDLVFQDPVFFGLRWNDRHPGLASGFTPESIRAALRTRDRLLRANPHMILLAELRHHDAPRSYLPGSHPWWRRVSGFLIEGWAEGGFHELDIANPEFRRQIVRQASALMKTGVVDGIMLDWWEDDEHHLALVRDIRRAIGESALILVNANDRKIPLTAPLINGLYMECTKTGSPEDWQRIAATLAWAGHDVRRPRINCLETWWHRSRNDLALMRLTTTLSLVLSDGYCLFCDPDPLPSPDHQHDWYPFWNARLGRPISEGISMPDGTLRRRFERGIVVCNPPWNAMTTVSLDKERLSWATGRITRTCRINGGDGDFFLDP